MLRLMLALVLVLSASDALALKNITGILVDGDGDPIGNREIWMRVSPSENYLVVVTSNDEATKGLFAYSGIDCDDVTMKFWSDIAYSTHMDTHPSFATVDISSVPCDGSLTSIGNVVRQAPDPKGIRAFVLNGSGNPLIGHQIFMEFWPSGVRHVEATDSQGEVEYAFGLCTDTSVKFWHGIGSWAGATANNHFAFESIDTLPCNTITSVGTIQLPSPPPPPCGRCPNFQGKQSLASSIGLVKSRF